MPVWRVQQVGEDFSDTVCKPDWSIDYRYADCQFTMSSRGVAVLYDRYLSSHETRFNAGISRWKLHLPEETRRQECTGGIYCIYNWKSTFLQPSLGIDNFKPWLGQYAMYLTTLESKTSKTHKKLTTWPPGDKQVPILASSCPTSNLTSFNHVQNVSGSRC
jgi:hypothetical protein